MTTQSMAEPAALSWAAEGDEAAWDALYREQMPRVYNFFRYRVESAADAEDLTSITFVKAWRNRRRYRSDLARFSTWLFAIARNVARDHYRARRGHLPIEHAESVAGGEEADEAAVRRSNAKRLSDLLRELSERERDLVSLKYGAECTNREIARATGLTETNVGTILHRAVARLRERWGED